MRPIVVAAVLALAAAAGAHAFLDHAEPRVGSTVAPGPRTVTLVFTEPIELAFCRIDVEDAGGVKLPLPAPEHPAPEKLAVALPALSPGEYTVHWAVMSVDTHPTEGSFRFSVKPRR